MKIEYDTNYLLQNIFNKKLKGIGGINWINWLYYDNKDYEEAIFKNTGIEEHQIMENIGKTTESKEFSLNGEILINETISNDQFQNLSLNDKNPILIHTSGTSGGDLSKLKWFEIKNDSMKNIWVSGIKAIYDSSFLDWYTKPALDNNIQNNAKNNNNINNIYMDEYAKKDIESINTKGAMVFLIPSGLHIDGVFNIGGNYLTRLYGFELTQRIAIALYPKSNYFIDYYSNAYNLSTILKILSLGDIAVIAVPYNVILNWNNPNKLKEGFKRELLNINELTNLIENKDSENLKSNTQDSTKNNNKINNNFNNKFNDNNTEFYNEFLSYKAKFEQNPEKTVKELQNLLKDKLKNAILISGTTYMIKRQWDELRSFMGWKKGQERLTNVYIGSEIGPFSATINKADNYRQYVMPLTIPLLERKNNRELLTRSKYEYGNLLISKMDEDYPIYNINTGDVITLLDKKRIPKISGEILRANFKVNLDMIVKNLPKGDIIAGDYFRLKDFEIVNSKEITTCISDKFKMDKNSPIILVNSEKYKLIVPIKLEKDKATVQLELAQKVKEELEVCPIDEDLKKALKDFEIELNEDIALEPKGGREELLKKVKSGEMPKGVLKKWNLYVINENNDKENNDKENENNKNENKDTN
ncbi:hypothetical protein [Methanococcus voltae]|uniref:Uncharacterized protein n=1 Tax=Methanococcus voltae (strain ATCC BAA-1334 / A3) TaxID=456320 RepID=D7DQM4_METV3|nr:hypothetical protein [Methanococcus voltae]MCS3901987.1 hypothetical protein [Methanococcus voltae]